MSISLSEKYKARELSGNEQVINIPTLLSLHDAEQMEIPEMSQEIEQRDIKGMLDFDITLEMEPRGDVIVMVQYMGRPEFPDDYIAIVNFRIGSIIVKAVPIREWESGTAYFTLDKDEQDRMRPVGDGKLHVYVT